MNNLRKRSTILSKYSKVIIVFKQSDTVFKLDRVVNIPAGTTKKDPSGDQANLRKNDGRVSS